MNGNAKTSWLKKRSPWIYWGLVTLLIGGYLAQSLIGEDKTVFLPGKTTHGHHQIEMACGACHTDPFKGGKVLQDACMNCHGAELKAANDSHPKSKFTDPRNADQVALLDARVCITCHREHMPGVTRAMGVTLPDDFCFRCHQDIAKDRPSHANFKFNTCATGGCHNFHDNQALYEDFLLEHLHEPATKKAAFVPQRNLDDFVHAVATLPIVPLTLEKQDAPNTFHALPKLSQEWASTAHAKAGVNCSNCHQVKDKVTEKITWIEKPDQKVCMECHGSETDSFQEGMHGMRLKQELSPMTPAKAELPMKHESMGKQLTCIACHGAHDFNTRKAAVESCLTCHNDQHSLAYGKSLHFKLWHAELEGKGPPNSGVSCATCHMPREIHKDQGFDRVRIIHNQNANLRPNEKMIRSVCMNCHGLEFSMDALADRPLIDRNFDRMPAEHLKSLNMAEAHAKTAARKKREEAYE